MIHIDPNINEFKSGKNWIKRNCRNCETGVFFVHVDWVNPPRFCEICRVRRIHKKESGLREFIKKKRLLFDKKKIGDEEFSVVMDIESKLNELNKKYNRDELKVFEELAKIKIVREALFDWDKQIKKSMAGSRRKQSVNLGLGGTFGGIVQGGAPK